jgi:hypothetical protein
MKSIPHDIAERAPCSGSLSPAGLEGTSQAQSEILTDAQAQAQNLAVFSAHWWDEAPLLARSAARPAHPVHRRAPKNLSDGRVSKEKQGELGLWLDA